MKKDFSIEKINQTLLQAILNGGLNSLATAIYQLTKTPLVIVDYSGRVLLQLPNVAIGEGTVWEAYRSQHFTTPEENEKFQNYFAKMKTPNSNIVYIDDKTICEGPILMGRFYQNGDISGHFGFIITQESCLENLFEIAELFSNILSSPWAAHMNIIPNNQQYQEYLLQILSGQETTKDFHLPGDFTLIVSPFSEQASSINKSYYYCICDYINSTLDATYSVVFEENIVSLIYSLPDKQRIEYNITSLNNYQLKCSISPLFNNITDMKKYYEITKNTFYIGSHIHKSKDNYRYEDYAPLQPLWNSKEKEHISLLIHPLFHQLLSYDKKYNTEYVLTYQTYLFNGLNRRKTAKDLNIHYNTLSYRLEKMNELFSLEKFQNKEFSNLVFSAWMIYLL